MSSSANSPPLPGTHRALFLTSTSTPPTVREPPTPQGGPGSAVLRILAAVTLPYMSEIYLGNARGFAFPTPLVPGLSAIGRVAAVGPDATSLVPGKLVLFDCTIRGRDDRTAIFLSGLHEGFSDGSRKLMHGEWKDSTYAEYAKVPLENCFPLDEAKLVGKLGYEIADVAHIARCLVPYGGLRDIKLQVGETVVIAPATASFGGAAVMVALAMGARVIAMGRNVEKLKRVAEGRDRVEIVPITGDVMADTESLKKLGPIDVFFDISPAVAAKSTHFKSAIQALTHGGRVSLMGGMREDIPFPHVTIMHRNLLLKGTWMYQREDVFAMIKMVENGMLKFDRSSGCKICGKFALEDWEMALKTATGNAGMGELTLFTP